MKEVDEDESGVLVLEDQGVVIVVIGRDVLEDVEMNSPEWTW